MRQTLPIDTVLQQIVESLQKLPNLVLEAPPGAGKTTRVPRALLALEGEVLVLEPRRLAARMAARRVAEELGERVGETVGYQVRFEEISGPKTRLRFLTEGVLTRRLLKDRELRGVGTVILDEFHERHLDGDLALALLRRLQKQKRPDLRIVVMSATLDAAPIAEALKAPIIRSEGKMYPLDIHYRPGSVEAALEWMKADGDVLVFLPGAREIRDTMRETEGILRKRGMIGLPLYGDLSPEEQDRAVMPAFQSKVIFSTNVAESSLTIEGVRAVIDAGTARVAMDDPWTGLPSLKVTKISQASAIQRAGRAARTAPGQVIRLYSLDDFHRRPAQDQPEILRRELSQMLLALQSMKIDPEALDWIDTPASNALDSARNLLGMLKADEKLIRYPVHPRLARLIEDAGREGARQAAHLLRDERINKLSSAKGSVDAPLALLRAFPDRVAKRLRDDEFLLATGGSAKGREIHADWIVVLDIENRFIRNWSGIEPDWLLDEFPDRITEREILDWNRQAERVDAVRRLEFERLAIIEERSAPQDASGLLTEKALEAGIEKFTDVEELTQIRARAEFAGEPITDEELKTAFQQYCFGARGFQEISGFSAAILRPQIDQKSPRTLRLPSGRNAKITYISGQPPFVASRMQDFFGMRETPRINGQTLVVHLLAPSQRPVQITQDLAGFWERHYPSIRKELMRKYPRHKWPEDPFSIVSESAKPDADRRHPR